MTDEHVEPLTLAKERLQDAISGERRDWHEVSVRPDDVAALLEAARDTARQPAGPQETE